MTKNGIVVRGFLDTVELVDGNATVLRASDILGPGFADTAPVPAHDYTPGLASFSELSRRGFLLTSVWLSRKAHPKAENVPRRGRERSNGRICHPGGPGILSVWILWRCSIADCEGSKISCGPNLPARGHLLNLRRVVKQGEYKFRRTQNECLQALSGRG